MIDDKASIYGLIDVTIMLSWWGGISEALAGICHKLLNCTPLGTSCVLYMDFELYEAGPKVNTTANFVN
jgi:hypothetical protein